MEQIVSWIITGVAGISLFFFKRTLEDYDERIRTMQKELYETRRELSDVRKDYLHRDDFKEFKAELRTMFEELKTDLKDLKNRHEKD